jgi:Acetyltransferase (GNAT) domain
VGSGGVFSSEPFLEVLNASWFDGAARAGDVAVGDHVVRTLIHGNRPIVDVTFLDFFVPLNGGTPEMRARYAPRVATSTHPADHSCPLDPLVAEPAPFVRWSSFGSWDDVRDHWRRREKGILRESRRRAGRLDGALGELRYTLDDRSEESFRACVAWKSQQFRGAGLPDPFDDHREEHLLRALLGERLAVLSSLHAGNRLVATHLGLVWDDTMHWWLPAYDREVGWASPGRLLLEWVMQQSYERTDAGFDFLRGGSAYKWNYATDYRVIAEAGRPPLTRRARLARARAIERYPRIAAAARSTRDAARPIWHRTTVAPRRLVT